MSTKTAEKWAAMQPRERDSAIAEKMFGFRWMRYHDAEYEKSHDGCVTATLCHPDQKWLEEPEYVVDTGEADHRSIPEPMSDVRPWLQWPPIGVPAFTTDASADYLVLRRIAETWDEEKQSDFICQLICELAKLHGSRFTTATTMLAYVPGTYSHAAYLALNG